MINNISGNKRLTPSAGQSWVDWIPPTRAEAEELRSMILVFDQAV
jgi:hypothetical protein